ncbi:MAG: hypothetical protein ACJZ6A_00785 [Candidatus Poseidoniaceae archaeon]|tara:strand:- start:227 stop:883 length:657 start_codon:yes stop_codon:yes gene_type:complete
MIEDKLAAKLGWLIPALTIGLSTLVHLLSGDYRAFPFFISEADYPGLQRVIFTSGFVIAGIVLIYVSWRLFWLNRKRGRWYWMHLSMLCGTFVGANLAIMAFMDMYDHIELHVLTALNVFHFSLAWGVVTHLGMKNGNQRGKNLRYLSITLGFIAFIGMSYAMGLAVKAHPEFLDTDDLNLIQPWINVAAPMEYLLAISFMLTLGSFSADMNPDDEEE